MGDIRSEERRCDGERPQASRKVDRGGAAASAPQLSGEEKPRQTGGLLFFGQRGRREKTLPRRQTRGKSRPSEQRRKARAQKNSVLIVKIGAGAGRNAEPVSNVDIVLREHARYDIGVGEPGNIPRAIGIALRGGARYPCIPADAASDGNLAEQKFVPVMLDHFAELMAMPLFSCREAGCYDITVF